MRGNFRKILLANLLLVLVVMGLIEACMPVPTDGSSPYNVIPTAQPFVNGNGLTQIHERLNSGVYAYENKEMSCLIFVDYDSAGSVSCVTK